jgi:K+-sensing histidine kinase KdpD
VFCIVLGAAAAHFFLIAPRFSFYIHHPGEVGAILLLVLTSLMMVIFVKGMRVASLPGTYQEARRPHHHPTRKAG